MSSVVLDRDMPVQEPPQAQAGPLRWLRPLGVVAGLCLLFAVYLRIAQSMGVNADGASNALQAWDMWHGNVLLKGWTVTDVPFYTNELLLFMLAELVVGYHAGVVNVVAALVFTLIVLLVGLVAKGRARGGEAAWRVALAVAVIGVPVLGLATSVQLTSPDHTGTAIPLLLTWLVLERAAARRWMPWAVLGLLALGQLSDPLVMYIGALPLVLVSLTRMAVDREIRGLNAKLVVAGVGSVVLAQLALLGIRLAGGFGAHAPPVEFADASRLGKHAWIAAQGLAGNFGAFFPNRETPLAVALGLIHLGLLVLAMWTVAVVVVRGLRRRRGREGDRLGEVAAVGILINIGAYVVSVLPGDLGTARQIVVVGPLSAVLVGRMWGPRLAAARPRLKLVAVALLVALAADLAMQTTAPKRLAEGHDAARWLQAQQMEYGLGSYWMANNLTLVTGGEVQVVPITGDDRIKGYRWESRAQWYDPALHDARFLVLDKAHPGMGSERTAVAQFGPPVSRHEFERAIVLVYDHNLLVGLPAYCVPVSAPSMAQCPKHKVPLLP